MRILIVKLSSFGDILHVLPTVHALREQTGAAIDWVVHPEFASLVSCFADVDETLTFPRREILRGLCGALRALRRREYDLIIDLHGLFKSGLVARLARGKRRIAPSYAREFSWIFFPERAGRPHRARHAVEQAMDILDYLELKRPGVVADASELFRLKCANLPPAARRIALAPVSRWETKNWPVEHFARLSEVLLQEIDGLSLVVLGGKDDAAVGDLIASAVPGHVENLCGRTSISQSLSILSGCDLLIANDTGPVHMAAAVGTRCLALFGPTRADWTGPYGEGHKILSLDLPCRPCLKRKCPRGDVACMRGISVEMVVAATKEILSLQA